MRWTPIPIRFERFSRALTRRKIGSRCSLPAAKSPPTLLLHGLADTVVDYRHAEKLRDALISHGAQVEAHFYAKRGHADTIGSFALALRFRTPALEQTLDFLDRVTAPSAKSDGD